MIQKTKNTLIFTDKEDTYTYPGIDTCIEVYKDEQLYCSFGTSSSESVEEQSKLIVKNLRLVGIEKIHAVKNGAWYKDLPKLKDLREAYKRSR